METERLAVEQAAVAAHVASVQTLRELVGAGTAAATVAVEVRALTTAGGLAGG